MNSALLGDPSRTIIYSTNPLTASGDTMVVSLTAARVPFVGPFTGAESLRTPLNRYIFNVRASYYDETEKIFPAPADRRTEDYVTGRFG